MWGKPNGNCIDLWTMQRCQMIWLPMAYFASCSNSSCWMVMPKDLFPNTALLLHWRGNQSVLSLQVGRVLRLSLHRFGSLTVVSTPSYQWTFSRMLSLCLIGDRTRAQTVLEWLIIHYNNGLSSYCWWKWARELFSNAETLPRFPSSFQSVEIALL